MLLPIGGPKGYGLAVAVDVLTGVLSGGQFGAGVKGLYADTSVPNDCAHFFLALNVESFADPQEFTSRLRQLAEQIKNSEGAPEVDRLLLPGQLEAERYEQSEEQGIRLDESTLTSIQEAADLVGAELPDRG